MPFPFSKDQPQPSPREERPESKNEDLPPPKLRIVEKGPEIIEAEEDLSKSAGYSRLMAEKAARAGELYEQNMLRARLLKTERGTTKWDKESPYYKEWLYTTRQVVIAEQLATRLAEYESIGDELIEMNTMMALSLPPDMALFSEEKVTDDLKFASRKDALHEQQDILESQIDRLEMAYLEADLLIKGCEQEKIQGLSNEDLATAKENKLSSEEMQVVKEVTTLNAELEKEEKHLSIVRGDLLSNFSALFVADRRKEISTAKTRVAELKKALKTAKTKMTKSGATTKTK